MQQAALLLMRPPADHPGKQKIDGLSGWAPVTHVGDPKAPDFAQGQHRPLLPLESGNVA